MKVYTAAGTLLFLVVGILDQLQNSLGTHASRLVGVGVAAPFQMGGWHRMLGLSQSQSDAWNRIDLSADVQTMTRLPVYFARDTAAACVAELVQGRGRDLKSFLYLFVDTFVGGGLVLNSHLHAGVHGNAGAVASLPLGVASKKESPEQLVSQASLWDLEQHFSAKGLDPRAAYDERALQVPWKPLTEAWMKSAACALAQCIVSGTAFVDVDAVVIDGALTPSLLQALIERIREVMPLYRWEGLWIPELHPGVMGATARGLGGALLPLHANFAPDSEVFLKLG